MHAYAHYMHMQDKKKRSPASNVPTRARHLRLEGLVLPCRPSSSRLKQSFAVQAPVSGDARYWKAWEAVPMRVAVSMSTCGFAVSGSPAVLAVFGRPSCGVRDAPRPPTTFGLSALVIAGGPGGWRWRLHQRVRAACAALVVVWMWMWMDL
jgi:hypothetical protein